MRRLAARQLFALTVNYGLLSFLCSEPAYMSGPLQGPCRSVLRATCGEIGETSPSDSGDSHEPNELLSALEAGEHERALELLQSPKAATWLRRRSRRRDCTPLMLAAGALGEIYEEVVERMLDFGSGVDGADVAAKSRSFRTAADYAAMHPGGSRLAARLRSLEDKELKETAHKRCPCCGVALMRRPRVASLADRYREGRHSNPLLRRFFQNWPEAWETLMRPEFHTFHKAHLGSCRQREVGWVERPAVKYSDGT